MNGRGNNTCSATAFTAIEITLTRDGVGCDIRALWSVQKASIYVCDPQDDTISPSESSLNGVFSTAPGRINMEVRELLEHLENIYILSTPEREDVKSVNAGRTS